MLNVQAVVLAEKMPIIADNKTVNETLLDELIANISNLASVYCKPVSQVGVPSVRAHEGGEFEEVEAEQETSQAVVQEAAKALGSSVGDLLDLGFDATPSPAASAPSYSSPARVVSNIDDLLGSVEGHTSPAMQVSLPGSPTGMFPSLSMQPGFSLPKTVYLSSTDSGGLYLEGTFVRK